MKKRLLSIWKDPVVSGLIVALIIFICGGIWTYFNWEKTKLFFINKYNKFINLNIPLYYVLLFLLVVVLVIWLLSKLKIFKVKSKEEHFRGDNYRYKFTNINVLCRYGVYVSDYTGKPFITNLKVYCDLHTPAFELDYGCCQLNNCENNRLSLDINNVEKYLEADIIHRWEEYDKKYPKR